MHEVEDEPLFAERAAGIDIAKAGIEVTIRVPTDTRPGRRQQETRSFGATRRQLEQWRRWISRHHSPNRAAEVSVGRCPGWWEREWERVLLRSALPCFTPLPHAPF